MKTRLVRLVATLMALMFVQLAGPSGASAAASHALIQGSGSSWAANAVNQWVADVANQGLQVVYTANGAAQGRKDYANKSTDFGVTDSPYRGKDPTTGQPDTSLGRSYAYLPIVSGGTSFPYHVEVGGKLIRNIRLSGETIAKIFTNKITNWNDPAIAADNNGTAYPSIPIIPVVRADGAGVTNQFTTWLSSQYPSIWAACNGGKAAPTDYFPLNCGAANGPQKAQAGSDGVMNYVKSKNANGAIAMEEYSYPLMANYPVAKLLNKAGYFTLPTQSNVAVALTQAKINNDPNDINYLTQQLDGVYVNADKRTYPLSSYVYAIIPTSKSDTRWSTAKWQTIADFLYYSICQGQSEIGPIGYSPLPVNLVQAGFEQIAKLKAADPDVDLDQRDVSTCHNPTFIAGKPDTNYLAQIAPQPPECDKVGNAPCVGGEGSYNENPGGNTPTNGGSENAKGGKKNGNKGTPTPGTATPGTGTTTPGVSTPGAGSEVEVPAVDPVTGLSTETGDVTTAGGTITVVPTTLAADSAGGASPILIALAVGVFVGALIVPASVSTLLGRSRKGAR